MKKVEVKNLLVYEGANIRDAIKQMDKGGLGIVFIINRKEIVTGVLTDGDFRRAILKGIDLNDSVLKVANKKFISVTESDTEKDIINLFLLNKIDRIPVISEDKLVNVLLREDYYLEGKVVLPENEKQNQVPVVIMAGGKGTRMKPFTNIFPKPLIPIGEKTMLEVIMDEYNKFGFNDFYITINYKGNLIKAYFEDFNHNYKLSFVEENKFLGTAGSLKLLPIKGKQPIFVSNCDILIKEDYNKILEFHNKGNYDLTLIAAVIHHQVPYGVCTIKNKGELDKLMEKPEYDYLVNSGMYVLNSNILKLIPDNEFFHITDLMEKVIQTGGKVGVYPVSEKSWIDVGQWEEYNKTLKAFLNE